MAIDMDGMCMGGMCMRGMCMVGMVKDGMGREGMGRSWSCETKSVMAFMLFLTWSCRAVVRGMGIIMGSFMSGWGANCSVVKTCGDAADDEDEEEARSRG